MWVDIQLPSRNKLNLATFMCSDALVCQWEVQHQEYTKKHNNYCQQCLWFMKYHWLDITHVFSPPVRWGLLDFMYDVLPSSSSFLLPLPLVRLLLLVLADIFAVLFARCRQMSTWTSRVQWVAPDLNKELQIAVGSAGPQPGSSGADWATPAPQPGSSGAEWATPDLTRGPPERSGQRRASAARRYVRRCVRNMSEKNVRKNVRRYVRRNVRKYVKRYVRRYVKRYIRRYVKRYVRRYVRRNVRRNVRRYVRRNVRRNVRRYVRRYVRKECQNICQKKWQKKCQKICQKI